MYIVIGLILIIGHYLIQGIGELHGKSKDCKYKEKREFVDPHLYRDHHGFIRDKKTNEMMFVQREKGRLYTVNGAGRIVRDMTELEEQLENEGKIRNGIVL